MICRMPYKYFKYVPYPYAIQSLSLSGIKKCDPTEPNAPFLRRVRSSRSAEATRHFLNLRPCPRTLLTHFV